jgi:hypothetical protein
MLQIARTQARGAGMDEHDLTTERRNARAAAGYVSSLMRSAARRRRAEAAGDARDPVDTGGEPADRPPAAATTRAQAPAPPPL